MLLDTCWLTQWKLLYSALKGGSTLDPAAGRSNPLRSFAWSAAIFDHFLSSLPPFVLSLRTCFIHHENGFAPLPKKIKSTWGGCITMQAKRHNSDNHSLRQSFTFVIVGSEFDSTKPALPAGYNVLLQGLWATSSCPKIDGSEDTFPCFKGRFRKTFT